MTFESNSDAPELLALRAETDTDPAVAARQRVLSRLAQSVPGLAAATATELVASEVLANAPQAAAPFALPAKLWILGAFALGGAAGAVTHAALETPAMPRVVYVDRVVSAPSLAVPAQAEPPLNPAPELPTDVAPEQARTRRPPSTQAARASDGPSTPAPAPPEPPAENPLNSASLAEQQALLDQARAALGRNDGQTAIETLTRHGNRFPESVLTEEREALAIKALVRLGNTTEARARLDAFERRFPRSPLLPSLRNALSDPVTETNRPGQ